MDGGRKREDHPEDPPPEKQIHPDDKSPVSKATPGGEALGTRVPPVGRNSTGNVSPSGGSDGGTEAGSDGVSKRTNGPTGDASAGRAAPVDRPQRTKAASCLEDNFLVEAGAGTGKTALLMERLRHIVCDRDVSMDEVVAITFTEKAAAELKSRFREELERWAAEARGHERKRIEDALREMDRAVISTIHSFCMGLLTERPVEAGVDPGFRVADEVEAGALFETAWEEWLQERMVPGNRRLRTAFAIGATLANTNSLARDFLGVRDMLEWIPAPVRTLDAVDLAGRLRAGVDSLRDLFARALRNPNDGIATQVGEIERTLKSIEEPEGGEDVEALSVRLASLEIKKKIGAVNSWSSKSECLEARGILSELRDGLEEFRKAFFHNAAVGLAEELRGVVEIYDRLKRERGVLDFDDLLFAARNLLRDSAEARSYFKRKYKFILIDEFQDTDPLQAEIAFFLAEELGVHCEDWEEVRLEQGKLFLVGDPKQSIYRFRRADIEVYERSKRAMCGHGSLLNIFVNFRSIPGVIDPVNLTFEGLMRRPEQGDYQPDYVPLEAFRREEAAGIVALKPGRRLPEDTPVAEKRAFEASAIAWLVKDAVEGGRRRVFDKVLGSTRPVRYDDVALLFWATTGLEIYEEALRAWEIPYRVAGGKTFYSRGEIQALVSVLSAVEDPHDGVAVVGALRSPFFGLSDDEIFLQWVRGRSLNYEEVEAEGQAGRAFDTLRELRGLRNDLPLAVFLDKLFDKTGALPAFYLRPQGEQRVANLLKVSTMAAGLDEGGPVTFKRFVRWTAEQGESGAQEGESPVREAGDSFVSVLTIHKAKGLEFPVVVLPGLWARGGHRAEHIVADRGSENLEISLSAGVGIATLGWAEAWEREKQVLEAERIRLLYVAMTRAKEKLVLPRLFGIDESGGETDRRTAKSHLSSLLPLLDKALAGGAPWAELIEVPEDCLKSQRVTALRGVQDGADAEETDYAVLDHSWKASLRNCLRRAARAEAVAHPTGLASGPESLHTSPPTGARMSEEIPGGRSFEIGRKVGKLVHRLLDALDPNDVTDLESLARSFAADLGLGGEAFENAVIMTRRFYESPFAERVRRAKCVRREVPFCVRLGDLPGGWDEPDLPAEITVEGVADLLLEEEDGWRVVDFKTDKVDESEIPERAAHHRLQGACYALCLSHIMSEPIREVIFYFLYPQVAHTFAGGDVLVEEARLALAQELRRGAAEGVSWDPASASRS